MSDINLKRLDDLQIIRVYLTIDVYLDLASGVLQTVRKKTKAVKNERGQCLINCKRISVLELKCTAKNLRDKKSNEFLSWKKIHQDTSIELFSLNEMFLVGAWNGNNVSVTDLNKVIDGQRVQFFTSVFLVSLYLIFYFTMYLIFLTLITND